MIAGYYHALERTLFFDHVPDGALAPWQVNCEVHRRGIEIIRPGARCKDIAHELNEIYAEHGLLERRTFGYGHSFGTLCHYYGREAGLEFREDVETVLVPGMVVSMEPMVTVPEGEPGAGGYREHDMLIVTEDGAENLTGFPFGPELQRRRSLSRFGAWDTAGADCRRMRPRDRGGPEPCLSPRARLRGSRSELPPSG